MKFAMKASATPKWKDLFRISAAASAALWLSSCANNVSPGEARGDYNRPMPINGPADSQAADATPPRQKSAEERPGLATGFGESADSDWHRQSFVRASSKPAGAGLVYYNDKEGIEAMTGSKRKVGGVETAAGDMIEWGIKSGFGYLPTYKTYSWGTRRFVVGEKDSDYSIVLKNRCKSRLEVVLSVDGLDVIDGKKAGLSKQGYVIGSGETLEVKGWRTSPTTVARFRFSTVAGSYTNLAYGDHRNVGVIGMAVFAEKGVDPWTWSSGEVNNRLEADPFAKAPGRNQ